MDPFEYLDSRGQFNIQPGLERMNRVIKRLDHPQRSLPAVIVGGTNGKGSTSVMTSAILESFTLRTGVYTSPHLIDITERLMINGRPVSRKVLEKAMSRILDDGDSTTFGGGLTYFELLTAASFLVMKEAGVDANISEVGMGGRWDATNILEPQAVAITSISMDHMEYLGDDPVSITYEKCGIIKPSTPVVMGNLCEHLEEKQRCIRTVLDICTHNGSPVVLFSDEKNIERLKDLLTSYNIPDWRIISVNTVTGEDGTEAGFRISGPDDHGQVEPKFHLLDRVMQRTYHVPLIGHHQGYNMGMAICLAMLVLPFSFSHSKIRGGDANALSTLISGSIEKVLEIFDGDSLTDRIQEGLENVRFRGRMEMMTLEGRRVIFDGGHNIEAARSISSALTSIQPGKEVHILLAMMGDKEPGDFLNALDLEPLSLTFVRLPFERSMSTLELLRGAVLSGRRIKQVHIRENIDDAIDVWLGGIDEDEIGLATGSFYLYRFLVNRRDD